MTQDARTETGAPRLYRLRDLLDALSEHAARLEHARATGQPMGPVTGIEQLDRQLCGCLQPGLHVLKGNTGAGKTAFALQVAANCQCPALYVSCEMSALELLRRHIARVTQTHLARMKDPGYDSDITPLTAEDIMHLAARAVDAAPQLVIVDSTRRRAFAPPDYLIEQARLLRQDFEAEHVLIVIDSLHSWARGIEGEEYARLEAAIDELEGVAADLDCPILCIAEQTKKANEAPESGALASAGHRAIGYGSESVITLNASDEGPNGLGETSVRLKLDKNRNGARCKAIHLKFHGSFQRFTVDVEHDDESDEQPRTRTRRSTDAQNKNMDTVIDLLRRALDPASKD